MLNSTQRWIIFALFCLATITCLGIEVVLVWSMINKDFSAGSTVATVMSTLLLGGIGVLFKKIVENTFVKPEMLPMDRLHQLATERSSILENSRINNQDEFQTKRLLITKTLQFTERTLNGWIPGTHFEFCVFIDDENPFLFSYFDSNHDTVARSMALREKNPRFYIDQSYEVTKTLASPTSQPRIINDTLNEKYGYTFTSKEQRNQIKSTVLLNLDLSRPIALVLSSDTKGAFEVDDPKLMPFIRYVGELIRSDLIDNGFVDNVRSSKPNLFPAMVPLHPLPSDMPVRI